MSKLIAGIMTVAYGGREKKQIADSFKKYGGSQFEKDVIRFMGKSRADKYGLWVMKHFPETEGYKKMVGRGPVFPGFEDYIGGEKLPSNMRMAVWEPYLKYTNKLIEMYEQALSYVDVKDIYQIKTLKDFKEIVREGVSRLMIKELRPFKEGKDYSFIGNEDGQFGRNFLVIQPHTFEVSKAVRRGASWCTTQYEHHFRSHKGLVYVIGLTTDFMMAVERRVMLAPVEDIYSSFLDPLENEDFPKFFMNLVEEYVNHGGHLSLSGYYDENCLDNLIESLDVLDSNSLYELYPSMEELLNMACENDDWEIIYWSRGNSECSSYNDAYYSWMHYENKSFSSEEDLPPDFLRDLKNASIAAEKEVANSDRYDNYDGEREFNAYIEKEEAYRIFSEMEKDLKQLIEHLFNSSERFVKVSEIKGVSPILCGDCYRKEKDEVYYDKEKDVIRCSRYYDGCGKHLFMDKDGYLDGEYGKNLEIPFWDNEENKQQFLEGLYEK